MKKYRIRLKITAVFLIVSLLLIQGGCGKPSGDLGAESSGNEYGGNSVTESVSNGESVEFTPADFLEETDVPWQDNSLDLYSAVVKEELSYEKNPDEIKSYATTLQVGGSDGLALIYHKFEEESLTHDEVVCVREQGDKKSERFPVVQIRQIGSIAGSNHWLFVIWDKEEKEGVPVEYLEEVDENLETVRTIHLGFLQPRTEKGFESVEQLMADQAGNIHIISYMRELNEEGIYGAVGYRYCIADADGNLLMEKVLENKGPVAYLGGSMVALYDGSVGLVCRDLKPGKKLEGMEDIPEEDIFLIVGSTLHRWDPQTGEESTLLHREYKEEDFMNQIEYFTLWDEETILAVTRLGICLYDLNWENQRPLYRWSKHGIAMPYVSDVKEMQIGLDGSIGVIYENKNSNPVYLRLEPTQEERSVHEIVFAASPFSEDTYRTAVARFNADYPAYHIELKTDYDQMALLTELIAGNGPVLIDTSLIGFEEQTKLWEPLDGPLKAMGLDGELIDKALEYGRIDGTLYGIVPCFALSTVVALDGKPAAAQEKWDYDSFLKAAQGIGRQGAITARCGYALTGYGLLQSFLIHGAEDNYLLDLRSGETIFRTEKFTELLDLLETQKSGQKTYGPESLAAGELLCAEVYLSRPEDVTAYRILYGEDMRYIGYPAKDGGEHYITSTAPTAIRKTASEEDKKIAFTFLREFLSYESQKSALENTNFKLSVRRDVLEEQIAAMTKDTMSYVYIAGTNETMTQLGKYLDVARDRATLWELIDQAKPQRSLPDDLETILSQEMERYFTGETTRKQLIDQLDNRVKLYMNER